MIEFTINGTTYEAEDGMTWGDWVESEYNTNSNGYRLYDLNNGLIRLRLYAPGYSSYSYAPVVVSTSAVLKNAVSSTDTIVNGTSYRHASHGGGADN